nr:DUF637 domain-containing protein [Xylella fastidiosa]
MIVNYVQQQGATAIGHWVATGQLTEGSPLHAALHALLACAGAAASQQRCSSGAQGAAASSVLTGLFSDTRPKTPPKTAKPNATSLPPSSPASPAPPTPMPPPPPMPPSLPWITTGWRPNNTFKW